MSNIPKLFYSEKQEVYYYVKQGETPFCDVCKREIETNLIYHSIWMKRNILIRLYHLNCLESAHTFGSLDEFKTCAVVETMPDDTLPIFERRPPLAGKNEYNTFQVAEITKGSEAEIKDRTRIAKDPNQSKMLGVETKFLSHVEDQNSEETRYGGVDPKRDMELGGSICFYAYLRKEDDQKQKISGKKKKDKPLTPDMKIHEERALEILQREDDPKKARKEMDKANIPKEIIKRVIPPKVKEKVVPVAKEKFYEGEYEQLKREYDTQKTTEIDKGKIIDAFYERLKKSQILLPGREDLVLIGSSVENEENEEDE